MGILSPFERVSTKRVWVSIPKKTTLFLWHPGWCRLETYMVTVVSFTEGLRSLMIVVFFISLDLPIIMFVKGHPGDVCRTAIYERKFGAL